MFIRKSKSLQGRPLSDYREDVLNEVLYNESIGFSHLAQKDSDLKDRLRLSLQSNGFHYPSFKETPKLLLCGSVNKSNPNSRVNKSHLSLYASQYSTESRSASVWMSEKQQVDGGFTVSFTFVLEKSENNVQYLSKENSQRLSSSFCFIIQAKDSVDSLQKGAPMTAGGIKKGLAIKLSVH